MEGELLAQSLEACSWFSPTRAMMPAMSVGAVAGRSILGEAAGRPAARRLRAPITRAIPGGCAASRGGKQGGDGQKLHFVLLVIDTPENRGRTQICELG